MRNGERILVVCAHPDDEVLGMGATLLKLSRETSVTVHLLFLSVGEASRGKREANERLRRRQARIVATQLKATCFLKENFPDNAFDSVPLLRIIQTVEAYLSRIRPTLIFTHHAYDLNIDHRLTFQAVYTATRPSSQKQLKGLYSFEVLSSTEWQTKNASTAFLPNTYVDIEPYIEKKILLSRIYRRELLQYPFPRSPEGIRTLARFRGMESGLKFAEAFQLIREIQQ